MTFDALHLIYIFEVIVLYNRQFVWQAKHCVFS